MLLKGTQEDHRESGYLLARLDVINVLTELKTLKNAELINEVLDRFEHVYAIRKETEFLQSHEIKK